MMTSAPARRMDVSVSIIARRATRVDPLSSLRAQ